MVRELVSRKTRLELREYFVGTSLSIIANEFDSADVPFSSQYEPNVSGQRRGMVEQYYHAIDWTRWADVRKFLTVYENVLSELEDHAENGQEWAAKSFKSLRRWIERDGFKYVNGKLDRSDAKPGLAHTAEAAGALDLPELQSQIQRLQSSLEHDPGLAIGTAKELVETVCKTILDQRSLPYADDADIGSLVKEARKALGLVPESIPNAARGAESIRRLLSISEALRKGLRNFVTCTALDMARPAPQKDFCRGTRGWLSARLPRLLPSCLRRMRREQYDGQQIAAPDRRQAPLRAACRLPLSFDG